jgi:hypothetical protein
VATLLEHLNHKEASESVPEFSAAELVSGLQDIFHTRLEVPVFHPTKLFA